MARYSLAIFFSTTIALLAIVGSAARMLPDDLRTLPIAVSNERPNPGCYLSTDNRTTLDQLVFHHDLENVRPALSNADVVFVGNSRSLCAFPEETCAAWFRDRGQKWYHAGFPAESSLFTQHILETYDVRAKLVVVNADDFFNDRVSAIALRSVRTSAFGAAKLYWESRLSYRTRRALHQWLPHPPTQFFAQESMIVHRSLNSGAWFVGDSRGTRLAVAAEGTSSLSSSLPSVSLPTEQVRVAEEFLQFVENRGGELVVTYVPSSKNQRRRAMQLAKELGCRFISPELDGLATLDGSHLDADSAVRFSTAFLRELGSIKTAMIAEE